MHGCGCRRASGCSGRAASGVARGPTGSCAGSILTAPGARGQARRTAVDEPQPARSDGDHRHRAVAGRSRSRAQPAAAGRRCDPGRAGRRGPAQDRSRRRARLLGARVAVPPIQRRLQRVPRHPADLLEQPAGVGRDRGDAVQRRRRGDRRRARRDDPGRRRRQPADRPDAGPRAAVADREPRPAVRDAVRHSGREHVRDDRACATCTSTARPRNSSRWSR